MFYTDIRGLQRINVSDFDLLTFHQAFSAQNVSFAQYLASALLCVQCNLANVCMLN